MFKIQLPFVSRKAFNQKAILAECIGAIAREFNSRLEASNEFNQSLSDELSDIQASYIDQRKEILSYSKELGELKEAQPVYTATIQELEDVFHVQIACDYEIFKFKEYKSAEAAEIGALRVISKASAGKFKFGGFVYIETNY